MSENRNKSLTFGTLPKKEEFMQAFARECKGPFQIRNDPRVGNTDYTAEELWSEVSQATLEWLEIGNEDAGQWASCVLSILGFEWI